MTQGLNRRAIALASLALQACATSPTNIYGGFQGQGVTGNEVSVIISNIWNEMDGLKLADAHCKKYGKAARLNRFEGYKGSYDCIAP